MAKNNLEQTSEQTVSFEKSLAEVEKIVSQLESGELGLTESLEKYERGIRQLKQCHTILDAAEQRVSVLSGFDADGNPVLEPMRPAGGVAKQPPTRKKGRSSTLNKEPGDDFGNDVDDVRGLF
jgi:exodeoxyribonuclease VII small subunit